jgi:hypothetical protein
VGFWQVDVDNSGAIDSFLAATVHLTELQNSLTKMLWLQNHCLCSPSLQIIGLKKSWKTCCIGDKGNGVNRRRTMRSKTNPGDASRLAANTYQNLFDKTATGSS